MTEDKARCAQHPEAEAESTCPRCGSFACAECFPQCSPWLCLSCRPPFKAATDPIYLRCQCCERPLSPGHVTPYEALHYFHSESFSDFVKFPVYLSIDHLSWKDWVLLLLEEVLTFSPTWLRADRCESCQHVMVDYRSHFKTGVIKARLEAGLGPHEPPWGNERTCPKCDSEVLPIYLRRRYPISFKFFEDFDRFFMWGYKGLLTHGLSWGQVLRDQWVFADTFGPAYRPFYRCASCGVGVLCYLERRSAGELRRFAKDARNFARRMRT